MKRTIACILMLASFAHPSLTQGDVLESQARSLLSEIASMSGGHYAPGVWRDRVAQVERLSGTARSAGNHNLALELQLVRGLIMAQVERKPEDALSLLDTLHRDYANAAPELRRRLYVARAEVLSLLGREAAISELIREFRASPIYDAEEFDYQVQEGRNTPILIRRPKGRGADSITVTAMEKFRQSARHAAGELAPLIEGLDSEGLPLRLTDYRGRVVLVDFWNAGWVAWQRDLPALKALHAEYNPLGFEVVGVPLGSSQAAMEFARTRGMTWRQYRDAQGAARQFGVYGEARNFLVNQDGVIIGRDLRGSDLRQAVQQALRHDL